MIGYSCSIWKIVKITYFLKLKQICELICYTDYIVKRYRYKKNSKDLREYLDIRSILGTQKDNAIT